MSFSALVASKVFVGTAAFFRPSTAADPLALGAWFPELRGNANRTFSLFLSLYLSISISISLPSLSFSISISLSLSLSPFLLSRSLSSLLFGSYCIWACPLCCFEYIFCFLFSVCVYLYFHCVCAVDSSCNINNSWSVRMTRPCVACRMPRVCRDSPLCRVLSYVACGMSRVVCRVWYVMCGMSRVVCHVSYGTVRYPANEL